ncbi:MAG: DUF2867 domain-containing protein [Calditrichaeota bacterium]|nr:MAG: DUF2867 domain-containing protein [Calditrichota bacterium]
MKILLTGANGYIGKRILPDLLSQGHKVVCMVRDRRRFNFPVEKFKDNLELIRVDLLKKETLKNIPKDIDAAYYLVHSMQTSSIAFGSLEEESAKNFVESINKTSTKQIIYLSGIANDENLSKHLSSRFNVEKILGSGKTPLTVLRAAIIIGSGSASFEIVRDLVEKLPVMVTPKWLNTKCQPISIRNVKEYLVGVLLNEKTYNKIFDIGGPDILSYKEMLTIYAKVRKLKRFILVLPRLPFELQGSIYWIYLFSSANIFLTKSLVESMKNEVICKNMGICEIVKITLLSYEVAIENAFEKITQNDVASSWKDALSSGTLEQNFLENLRVPVHGCLTDVRKVEIKTDVSKVKQNIWRIGGKNGWYYWNWAWKVRGVFDKISGGVGLRRGRKNPTELKAGDALDFWRVLLADEPKSRLVLFAEMKVPGEAWLELKIVTSRDDKVYYKQTATFRPSGLLGRLYWYFLIPSHAIIFRGMAKRIAGY